MEFRILGPLQVVRDGTAIEPGSPKQRGLLANLVVHHGRAVPRDRLIEDLWGGSPPATGLGVLQNYVSQLRKTLGADVVVTRGPGYALDVDPDAIDSVRFERLVERGRTALESGDAHGAAALAAEGLGLWRGPALADVAGEPFAQPEISRLEELRVVALELGLEAEIAGGRHRAAVAAIEAAVADHPFRERLWWLLMLALYRSGRQAEALRAYQRARTALSELGLEPGGVLRDLETAVLDQRADLGELLVASPRRRRPPRPARPTAPLLGRGQEWAAIEAFLDGTSEPAGGLLLLVGEPGIGKTRLLEEAQHRVEAHGGTVIAGRGFEAEHGRPYGAWVDALRGTPLPALDASQRTGLAALLPELADSPVELHDPNRLYDAVAQLVRLLAGNGPVAVLMDDMHWLDDPSLALLHFVIRRSADVDAAFVATARPGELDNRAAGAAVVQALRRDDKLRELFVGPLAPSVIGQLTGPIAPGADSDHIARATHGNPLFALELARALAHGDDPLSSRLDALISDRLSRLDERASALVPWMAAFGRSVAPSVLARLVERDPAELFEPVGDLERRGVLRADDEGRIEFVHDLVRHAAYTQLSTPRRAMLHARIADVLASLGDPDDSVAAEAARHADLGGASATCAAASVQAARRCLRLVAYREAEALVALGRRHARRLPAPERVAAELDLIHLLLHPGVRLREPGELARDLTDLCAEAQRLGLDSQLSTGLSLLARAYHWGWGDIPRARALMQRAVTLIERARTPDIEPLLEGARCLAYLEMDMGRTAVLFDELGSLHALAAGSVQYQWGLGLVHAWRGDVAAARAALGEAAALAAAREDHWASFECTARGALLELEAGEIDAAVALAEGLAPLAAKLGEGSERHYARAVVALCGIARQQPTAIVQLDQAISALEGIDARFLVPDLHGIAAELHLRAGELDLAGDRARKAALVAGEVARPFETARAHAVLACIAARHGDRGSTRDHLRVVEDAVGLPGHVGGLRQEAERLLEVRPGHEGADA